MKTKTQFFALATFTIIVLAIIGCKHEPEPETIHTHQWGDWTVTTTPTCITEGEETRVCTIDPTHKETHPLVALGHNYVWVTSTAPTCTEAGLETGTCTHDGSIVTRTIAALGHIPNTDTGFCTVCGVLVYNLGDIGPGGGKIFYISETGFTMTDNGSTAHYLEAASADMQGSFSWSSSGFDSTDITGTEKTIGTGRKNTSLMLNVDSNSPAARICNEYTNNGKTDWFLPSIDEIYQLYVNQEPIGNLGGGWVWSSSQDSNNLAWLQNYGVNGRQDKYYKNTAGSIRAIRAF
jgi:hypothetical protein